VITNNVGVYEADLPLGDYTMTAQGPLGFRPCRRPLFRLPSATAILNATLLVGNPCGDMIVVINGKPATQEQWEAATGRCRGEELIPIPSGDGLPLQLSIRYGSRTPSAEAHNRGKRQRHRGERIGRNPTRRLHGL